MHANTERLVGLAGQHGEVVVDNVIVQPTLSDDGQQVAGPQRHASSGADDVALWLADGMVVDVLCACPLLIDCWYGVC